MRTINNGIRKTVINITRIIVWSELAADIIFFVFFYFTDGMTRSVPSYVAFKIVLPFVINLSTFIFFKKYNENKDHSMLNKNVVCAFALTTIAGSAAICHGYYVPLWLTPSLVMIFCTIFHSDRLQRWLLIYNYIIILLGCAVVSWENPYNTSYYIQNAVVVLLVATLFNMIASVMNKYNQEMVGLTRNFHDKQMEYKEKLETDFLTKLFSTILMVALSLHAILGMCSVFLMADGTRLSQYPRQNLRTIVQRISAALFFPLLFIHTKTFQLLKSSAENRSWFVFALLIITEILFFADVILHTAVSLSRALITLGWLSSWETQKKLDRTLSILGIILFIIAAVSVIRTQLIMFVH